MAKRITINELDKSALSSSVFEDGRIVTTDAIKDNMSHDYHDDSKEKIASTKLTHDLDGRVDTVETLIENSNKYLFVSDTSTDYDESGISIMEENGIATVTFSESFTLPNFNFSFPLNLLISNAAKITITNNEGITIHNFNFTEQVRRAMDSSGRAKYVNLSGSEINRDVSRHLFNLIVTDAPTITPEGGSVTICYPLNQITAEILHVVNKRWYDSVPTT